VTVVALMKTVIWHNQISETVFEILATALNRGYEMVKWN